MVLSESTVALFGAGCALIVATVGDDRAPRALRGWGASVVAGEPPVIRLVLDADDDITAGQLLAGSPVAVTVADVYTLRSAQLKGRSRGVVAATAADLDIHVRYCDSYFDAVRATDGIVREKLERLRPARLVACEVDVDEVYDQTPGPGAGTPLSRVGS